MSKFDLNAWKSFHPASTEGSGITAAVKEWQTHCPDKFDVPHADPKKTLHAVATTTKKFLAAIADAEHKLDKDKSADPKTKDKIAKTRALLNKWETEVANYHRAVVKWSEATIKEESAEQKSLQRAQLEFASELVDDLEAAISKLTPLVKDFETALKVHDLKTATAKFNAHRDLVTRTLFMLRPVSVISARNKTAGKYGVSPTELKVPPKFDVLAKKIGEANEQDDAMDDRLDRASKGDFEHEAKAGPDGKANDPKKKKAANDVVAGYKGLIDRTSAKTKMANQLMAAANQLRVAPASYQNFEKAVMDCRVVNQKLLALNKEVFALRKQYMGRGSQMDKQEQAAGLTEAEEKKTLVPLRQVLHACTKHFVQVCGVVSDNLDLFLAKVIEAHPESQEAKTELVNLRAGKYTLRLL